MRSLMEERDLSFRNLAARTERFRDGGLSLGYLGRLAQGKDHPTLDTIAVIAQALDTPPDVFPEYRLALWRQQLDERAIGLDQALANLNRVEAAMQSQPSRMAPRALAPEEASSRPRRASGRARRSPRED